MTDELKPSSGYRATRRLGWLGDLFIGLMLAVLAATGTVYYLSTTMAYPAPRDFPLFSWFALTASLNYSQGNGLVTGGVAEAPQIKEFLTGAFETLPEPIPKMAPAQPFRFVAGHQYLLKTIGIFWRLFGVSWRSVYYMDALMFALSILAAYGIFRLGLSRPIAIACTLLFMCFPSCIAYLHCPRDLGKAPFVLGLLFVSGLMVKRRLSAKAFLTASVVAGALIGFGLGFRADLRVFMAVMPLIVLVVAAPPLTRPILVRGLATCLLLATTFGSGWSIFQATAEGGDDTGVNLLGGFTETIMRFIGLGDAPYALLGEHNDAFIAGTAIDHYARHTGLDEEPLPNYKDRYAPKAAAVSYFGALLNYFPADILMRAYGSVTGMLEGAPADEVLYYDLHTETQKRILQGLADWMALGALHMHAFGRWYAVAALLLIATRSLRLALATLVLLLMFGGYPSLQFGHRHVFHLGVLMLFFPAFVFEKGLFAVLRRPQIAERFADFKRAAAWPGWQRSLGFAVTAFLLLALPMFLARVWQHVQVGRLYTMLDQVKLEPLGIDTAPDPKYGNMSLVAPKGRKPPEERQPERVGKTETCSDYLMFEIDNEFVIPSLGVKYADAGRTDTLSLTKFDPLVLWGARTSSVSRHFLPVFEARNPLTYFSGLVMRERLAGRVKGIYRVANADELPLLLRVTLPEEWQSLPRHMSMAYTELPPYFRTASVLNVLENGGFEDWTDGEPTGFIPPVNSVLSPEKDFVEQGRTALRQTWKGAESASIYNQFRAVLRGLKPNTRYALQFQAANPDALPCRVSILQRAASLDGDPLHARCYNMEIRPSKLYRSYFTNFATASHPDMYTYISVFGQPDLKAWAEHGTTEASVFWDDWRLVELGPLPEGIAWGDT